MRNELAVVNDAGDIEVIDLITGELVINNRSDLATHPYAFSYEKALLICQLVKEGKTFNEIALMPDMPPLHIIGNWQRIDRMFAEEIKLARAARAEYHHERILDIAKKAADGMYSKDDVPGVKMGADLYKWSAEKANPEKYGSKVVHEGSTEKPILLRVINTGINRAAKADVVVEAVTKGEPDGSKTSNGSSKDSEGED